MGTKKQRGYSIKEKLAVVDFIERIGLTAAVEKLGHGAWVVGMIAFTQENYPDWIEAYAENKTSDESGRRALERLLQRTDDRYGFSPQNAQETKLPSVDLKRLKTDFAIEFWCKYGSYSLPEIYNMDETAIQFDIPPARTWTIKGRKGSARVQNLTKHCGRMTAVMTARADVEGMRVVAEQACAAVVPLPAKATSSVVVTTPRPTRPVSYSLSVSSDLGVLLQTDPSVQMSGDQ
ncbi:uncharacterized protein PITG_14925 [Phytophthora infestans T30-4]|uniref:DDE-1 domain-containing protein n=1 Tax=Phytophthora infestans (strain T30-4) TaxID=403677 RepID=D0NPC1_PHYIT|nr:uncharacterized protein PITG_14925 [Phytophthora infestans T30-4]EEY62463.1 conserved hypothetical protein [Phytophthora infestans T30-4]|eukprot:XP_002899099.1 conserved hypothetical protein [Phytophthora infestans T30-4]